MEWRCARWAKSRTDAVQATDKVLLCDPVLIREGHYAFNDVAVVLVALASQTADTGARASKYLVRRKQKTVLIRFRDADPLDSFF